MSNEKQEIQTILKDILERLKVADRLDKRGMQKEAMKIVKEQGLSIQFLKFLGLATNGDENEVSN